MQHASLASIGRRAIVDTQDSFENRGSPREVSKPLDLAAPSFVDETQLQPPRVLRLSELVHHLRVVDGQLRELHTKIEAPTSPTHLDVEQHEPVPSPTLCCRRLGDFVHAARRAINLHVQSVRLETFESCLLELTQSVDQIAEQEYANVSAGATCLIQTFTRASTLPGRLAAPLSAKTRIGAVRSMCEGLRQGLSLVSRTNTLLASEFGEYTPPPDNHHKQTFAVVSVLITASHIVHSGLMLLAQSELTRYTHSELWEITRGIEELSMLIEKVQEKLDEKKQLRVRRLLLERPFTGSTVPLYHRLSELYLLTDPIDCLRPASVGHVIYLLSRYRATTLTHSLAGEILKALRKPSSDVDCWTDVVRKEYEFCSTFLDVIAQSTELLSNLRRAQQCFDAQPKSILHKPSTSVTFSKTNDSKSHRKPVHITKTESIDKFISTFPVKPTKQGKRFPSIEEVDGSEEERIQRKVITWSDYWEVSLRHQVVGRYLQLTWIGFSRELDGDLQLVGPTVLSNSNNTTPPWPLLSREKLRELITQLRTLNECRNFAKTSPDFDQENFLSEIPGAPFRFLLQEAQKIPHFKTPDLISCLPPGSHGLFQSLARQCKNSIPPLEFSHRAFRLHLNLCTDTIERLLKQILLETLSTYHNLPKDVSSALQLFDSTWRNCDEINHCLSLLELIMQLMAYFNSLRQPPKSHGGINEEITFRVEDAQLQNFQLRWEFLHDKIKVCVSGLCGGFSRQFRQIAALDALNLQKIKFFSQKEVTTEVENYCQHLTVMLESLARKSCQAAITKGLNTAKEEADNSDSARERVQPSSTLVTSVFKVVLECLEHAIPEYANLLPPDGLSSFQCLLAKVVVYINQVSIANFVDNDEIGILRGRCVSLTSFLTNPRNASKSSGELPSPSSRLIPKDAVNRLQQYLSKNVLTPLHNVTPLSTLGTLSANVKGYFQHEDIISRQPIQPRDARNQK